VGPWITLLLMRLLERLLEGLWLLQVVDQGRLVALLPPSPWITVLRMSLLELLGMGLVWGWVMVLVEQIMACRMRGCDSGACNGGEGSCNTGDRCELHRWIQRPALNAGVSGMCNTPLYSSESHIVLSLSRMQISTSPLPRINQDQVY